MKIVILILILINYKTSQARGPGGIQNCDGVVCKGPNSISVSTDLTEKLERLGVTVSSTPIQVQAPPERVVFTPPPEIPPLEQTKPNHQEDGGQQKVQNLNPVNSDTTTADAGFNNQQTPQKTSPKELNAANGNPNNVQLGSQNNSSDFSTASNGTQRIGQNIYSDEADDNDSSDEIKNETKLSKTLSTTGLTTDTPTKPANEKNDRSPASALPAVSTDGGSEQGASLFGNFKAGGNNNSKVFAAQESAVQQALKKMNGEGFFGAGGSKGPRKRHRNGKPGRFKREQSIGHAENINKKLSYKQILQKKLLRKLASTGQLGKKNEFLFFSMCQHYDSYERSNNIDYGRSKCPSKK